MRTRHPHFARRAARAVTALLLLSVVTAFPGVYSAPATMSPATRPAAGAAGDERTKALLERRLPEVRFDGVPFSDVMDFLHDASRANLLVDWRSAEAAGVGRDAPVTVRLANARVADALKAILDSAGGRAAVPLRFAVDGGVIVISTQAGLDRVAASARTLAASAHGPKVRAAMDRSLPEVRFDGVGLSDVLDFFRDVTGVPVHVDWAGLQRLGIDRDAPVSMRLGDVSAGSALRYIVVLAVAGKEAPVVTADAAGFCVGPAGK